jgi:imidazole glycerol phosphate synthase subunit HisF
VKDGGVVKGIKSLELRCVKSLVWIAEAYYIDGVDEPIFIVSLK